MRRIIPGDLESWALGYLSLYRRYRSQTFSDLIGQDHVIRTLQNGITSGRISHSYLFTGPRGTGKTSAARLLAKALCCEKGPTPEPCNVCEICVSITEGSCLDVIEMDAASDAGVEDIREGIVEVVEYQPMVARYKVFIIDEVHDLSAKAFDALLKTVEEPPAHVIFILATTEYNKVPPTIRSRCQKHEFHRGSVQDLVVRLSYVAEAEGIGVEPAALTAMARMADGGFRDALQLLEQAMITSDGQVTLTHVYDQLGMVSEEVVDGLLLAMKQKEIEQIVELLSEVGRRGRDPRAVLESMLYRLSDLTRAAYGVDVAALGDATQGASMHETATRLGKETLLALRGEISEIHREIRDVTLPKIWLESEIIRIALKPIQGTAAVSTVSEKAVAGKPTAERSAVGGSPTAGNLAPTTSEDSSVAAAKAPAATEASAQGQATSQQAGPERMQPAHATGGNETSSVAETAKTPMAVTQSPAEPAPIEASGDPELDRIRAVWATVVRELSSKSDLMAMKLSGTQPIAVTGTTATIEFKHQSICEWVLDVPKRKNAILELFQSHAGADWQVEYVVNPPARGTRPAEAVELPAEGPKLAEMAREVFGSS